ncbi:MAG: carbon starvation protein A [Firmicutes bacterium]|nr:carbon starvation protein A [Bacillota bacterium]
MITFICCIAFLIVGYIFYGGFVEKIFAPDERTTPAIEINDGVDCVPMKTWKAFLIQLLNIAGPGPIFGALMGAVFGPIAFLWIIFGSVLGGAVHDYMSGMISERHSGQSVAELSGVYLGNTAKYIVRVFTLILLILAGTVLVTSPAALLSILTPEILGTNFWTAVILIYYVLATLLPIDKIIGRLYPIFGIALILMAVGIICGIIFMPDRSLPEMQLKNLDPEGVPAFPFMFVTIACGAVSGFHATQSPMIAKCITSEKAGRVVFYGAMLTESVIALIWASVGIAYYGTTSGLSEALENFGQAGVVYEISTGLLGKVGGLLAIAGVIICPITSGDTAFRSIRLIIAEWIGLEQKSVKNRLKITVPLLIIGVFITQLDFDVLWRYVSWSNQTIAMMSLWVATAYLLKKNKVYSFVTAIPASFMSAVSVTYILMADEGFRISASIAYPCGIVFAVGCFAFYIYRFLKNSAFKKAV